MHRMIWILVRCTCQKVYFLMWRSNISVSTFITLLAKSYNKNCWHFFSFFSPGNRVWHSIQIVSFKTHEMHSVFWEKKNIYISKYQLLKFFTACCKYLIKILPLSFIAVWHFLNLKHFRHVIFIFLEFPELITLSDFCINLIRVLLLKSDRSFSFHCF